MNGPSGKDTVALVTGATGGIGGAVAQRLAARGAHVLVHGHEPGRAAELAARLGGTAVVADFGSPSERRRLIDRLSGGGIDILVNNAGIGWSGPLTAMPPELLNKVLEVNLTAALELTSAVLPVMLQRGRGDICFVTSVSGRVGVAGEAVYAAAKAGVDAFAESLRAEAADTDIHVGVVVPSIVDTGFFSARGRPINRRVPRPVSPEVVADAVMRVLDREAAELWVPRWLRLAPIVYALVPPFFRLLSHHFGEPVRLVRTSTRQL